MENSYTFLFYDELQLLVHQQLLLLYYQAGIHTLYYT